MMQNWMLQVCARVNKQLQAKIELLRGNLESARAEAEESQRLRETVQLLKGQLELAAPAPDVALLQSEIRHLKHRLASRASMADQELQAQNEELKRQLATSGAGMPDEKLRQEVRALRQQLVNRQTAAARAAELQAEVWNLTRQLQEANAAMAAAAAASQPPATDGPRGTLTPRGRAGQRGTPPPQPRLGDSPRQRASPRPPDSPLPRGTPHPLVRSRSSQQLGPRRSSEPGGPSLGFRQPEIEAASPRGVPNPSVSSSSSLLRTGSMDFRRSLPAAAPVPAHLIQAAAVEVRGLQAENAKLAAALETAKKELRELQQGQPSNGRAGHGAVIMADGLAAPDGLRFSEALRAGLADLQDRLCAAEAQLDVLRPDPMYLSTRPKGSASPEDFQGLSPLGASGEGEQAPCGCAPSKEPLAPTTVGMETVARLREDVARLELELEAARADVVVARQDAQRAREELQAALASLQQRPQEQWAPEGKPRGPQSCEKPPANSDASTLEPRGVESSGRNVPELVTSQEETLHVVSASESPVRPPAVLAEKPPAVLAKSRNGDIVTPAWGQEDGNAAKLGSLQAESEAARRDACAARDELEASRMDLQRALEETSFSRDRLQAAKAQLEQTLTVLAAAEAQIQSLAAELEQVRDDRDDAQARVADLEAALVSLESAQDDAIAAGLESEAAGVRRVEAVQRAVAADAALEAVQAAHAVLQGELVALAHVVFPDKSDVQLAQVLAAEVVAEMRRLQESEAGLLQELQQARSTVHEAESRAEAAHLAGQAALKDVEVLKEQLAKTMEDCVHKLGPRALEQAFHAESGHTAPSSVGFSGPSSLCHSPQPCSPSKRSHGTMEAAGAHGMLHDNLLYEEPSITPATMSLASDSDAEGNDDDEPNLGDIPAIFRKFKKLDAKQQARRARHQWRELRQSKQRREGSSGPRNAEAGIENGDSALLRGSPGVPSGRRSSRSPAPQASISRTRTQLEAELLETGEALEAVQQDNASLVQAAEELEERRMEVLQKDQELTRLQLDSDKLRSDLKSAESKVQALSQELNESAEERNRLRVAEQRVSDLENLVKSLQQKAVQQVGEPQSRGAGLADAAELGMAHGSLDRLTAMGLAGQHADRFRAMMEAGSQTSPPLPRTLSQGHPKSTSSMHPKQDSNAELLQAREEANLLRKQLEQIDLEKRGLEERLQSSNHHISQQKSALAATTQELKNLRDRHKQIVVDAQRLLDHITGPVKEKLADREAQIKARDEQLHAAHQQVKRLEEEVKQQAEDHLRTQNELRSLMRDNEARKTQAQTLEQQLKTMEQGYKQVQQQHNFLRAHFEMRREDPREHIHSQVLHPHQQFPQAFAGQLPLQLHVQQWPQEHVGGPHPHAQQLQLAPAPPPYPIQQQAPSQQNAQARSRGRPPVRAISAVNLDNNPPEHPPPSHRRTRSQDQSPFVMSYDAAAGAHAAPEVPPAPPGAAPPLSLAPAPTMLPAALAMVTMQAAPAGKEAAAAPAGTGAATPGHKPAGCPAGTEPASSPAGTLLRAASLHPSGPVPGGVPGLSPGHLPGAPPAGPHEVPVSIFALQTEPFPSDSEDATEPGEDGPSSPSSIVHVPQACAAPESSPSAADAVGKLREQLERAREEVQEVEASRKQVQAVLARIRADRNEVKAELQRLRTSLQQATPETAYVRDLQNQVDTLRTALQGAEEKLQQAEVKLTVLPQKEARVSDLEEQLSFVNHELESSAARIAAAEILADESARRRRSAERELEDLRKQLDEKPSKDPAGGASEGEAQALRQALGMRNAELADAASERDLTKKQLADAKAEIARLTARMDEQMALIGDRSLPHPGQVARGNPGVHRLLSGEMTAVSSEGGGRTRSPFALISNRGSLSSVDSRVAGDMLNQRTISLESVMERLRLADKESSIPWLLPDERLREMSVEDLRGLAQLHSMRDLESQELFQARQRIADLERSLLEKTQQAKEAAQARADEAATEATNARRAQEQLEEVLSQLAKVQQELEGSQAEAHLLQDSLAEATEDCEQAKEELEAERQRSQTHAAAQQQAVQALHHFQEQVEQKERELAEAVALGQEALRQAEGAHSESEGLKMDLCREAAAAREAVQEAQKLTRELEQATARLSSADNEVAQLGRLLEEQRAELVQEVEQATAKRRSADEEVVRLGRLLEEQHAGLLQELQEATSRITAVTNERMQVQAVLESQSFELRSQLEHATSRRNAAEERAARLEQSLEQLSSELRDARVEAEELQEALREQTSRLDEAQARTAQDGDEAELLRSQLADHALALDQARHSMAAAEAEASTLRDEAESVRCQLAGQTHALDQARQSLAAAEAEVRTLREEAESLRCQLAGQTDALDQAMHSLAAAEAEVRTLREEVESMRCQLAGQGDALDQARRSLTAGEAEGSALREEAESLKCQLAERTDALHQARSSLSAAESEGSTLREEADSLKCQLAEQTDALDQARHSLAAAKAEGSTLREEAETLRCQLAGQADTLDQARRSLAAANAEVDQLQRKLAEKAGALEEAMERLVAAQEDGRAHAKNIDLARAEAEAVKEELGRFNRERGLQISELYQATTRAAAAESESEQIRVALEVCGRQLEEATARADAAEGQAADSRRALQDLEAKLTAAESELARQQADADAARAGKAQAEEDHAAQVEVLEAQAKQATADVAELQRTAVTVQRAHMTQQDQLWTALHPSAVGLHALAQQGLETCRMAESLGKTLLMRESQLVMAGETQQQMEARLEELQEALRAKDAEIALLQQRSAAAAEALEAVSGRGDCGDASSATESNPGLLVGCVTSRGSAAKPTDLVDCKSGHVSAVEPQAEEGREAGPKSEGSAEADSLQARLLATEQQVKALQEQLDEEQNSHQDSARGLQGCEEDRRKLNDALKDQKDKVDSLQAALDQASADLEAALSRIADLEASSSPTLNGGYPLNVPDLQAQLAEKAAEVARKEDELAVRQEELAASHKHSANLEAQLADMLRHREAHAAADLERAEAAEAEAAHQRAMLRAAQDQVEALTLKLQASDEAMAIMHRELEAAASQPEAPREADRPSGALGSGETEPALLAAQEKLEQALQEKRVLQEQAKKQEKSWVEEKGHLTAKLERLHKMNADKRQEIEQLKGQAEEAQEQLKHAWEEARRQADLSAQAASALAAAEADVASLRGKMSEYEGLATQLEELRAASVALQGSAEEEWARAARAEEELQHARQELDALRNQVMLLGSAKAEVETLVSRLAGLEKELEVARREVELGEEARATAEAAEASAARTRAELASGLVLRSQLEEKLVQAQQDLHTTKGLLEEERRLRGEAARSFAEEMEGLTHQPLAGLPPNLRQLVETHVASALQSANERATADAEAMEVAHAAVLESGEEQKKKLQDELRRALFARDEAEQRMAHLENELQEREQKLTEKLQEAERRVEEAEQLGELDAARLAREVDDVATASRFQIASWKAKCEGLQQELVEVKQRAVDLLEEKERELRAARAKPQSEGRPASSTAGTEGPPLPDLAHLTVSQGANLEPHQGQAGGDVSNGQAMHLAALSAKVSQLQAALAESENTHRLRDQAQEVAKEEINELRRQIGREGVNVEYLKGVIVGAFESGEFPRTSAMLPVLERLLHFSPADLERINRQKKRTAIRAPTTPRTPRA
eukprot:jgi/Botrbrau1/4517/Bobra.60_2s0008.1